MDIQYFSDLHIDINEDCETHFEKMYALLNKCMLPTTKVFVFAGDTINEAYKTVDWIHDVASKHLLPHQYILYIFGNHEFYDRDIKSSYEYAMNREQNPQVKFLHCDTHIVIDDVLFVGDVLWTDMKYGDAGNNHFMLSRYMNDYKCIVETKNSKGYITTSDTARFHHAQFEKIYNLIDNHDGKIVCITHHSPTPLSISPQYVGKPFNCGYCSDLYYSGKFKALEKVVLWIHGHVHDTVDVTVFDTNIVANPFGYMKWYGGHIENDLFKFVCIKQV